MIITICPHFHLRISVFKSSLACSYYQKACFNTIGPPTLQKTLLVELLKFNGRAELAAQLVAWTIPVYPMKGDVLRANGCPGGVEMGQVQQRLRDQWKESRFQLTQDDLLALLPDAIERARSESPPKRHKKA